MKGKRLISVILAVLMLCCMAIGVSASYECEYLGDLPEVEFGVDVDAVKDDLYENALCLELNREYPNEEADPNGTHGTAWLVYYNKNLYAYVEIIDSDIVIPDENTQKTVPWETDSVEIFLNAENSDDELDTIQHRIDVTGWPSIYSQGGINDYGPVAVGNRFEYACRLIDGGYALEFGFSTEDSKTFGIQMQINDKTSDGKLYHVMSPSEYESESWTADLYPWTSVNGEGKDYVKETQPETQPETQAETKAETASDTKAETVAETKAESQAETKPTENTDNVKSDKEKSGMPVWGIVLIAAGVVAIAVAVFVVIRKKKS